MEKEKEGEIMKDNLLTCLLTPQVKTTSHIFRNWSHPTYLYTSPSLTLQPEGHFWGGGMTRHLWFGDFTHLAKGMSPSLSHSVRGSLAL